MRTGTERSNSCSEKELVAISKFALNLIVDAVFMVNNEFVGICPVELC